MKYTILFALSISFSLKAATPPVNLRDQRLGSPLTEHQAQPRHLEYVSDEQMHADRKKLAALDSKSRIAGRLALGSGFFALGRMIFAEDFPNKNITHAATAACLGSSCAWLALVRERFLLGTDIWVNEVYFRPRPQRSAPGV